MEPLVNRVSFLYSLDSLSCELRPSRRGLFPGEVVKLMVEAVNLGGV